MLEALFGSKSIHKILLFLFVNGKAYGTQLHKQLQTPLTPIQKALSRLEKAGILMSYQEGKNKLYHFNPSFALLKELEWLLQKNYSLLSSLQKKRYYVPKEDKVFASFKLKALLEFWDRLSKVKTVSFNAQTKGNSGWNGSGRGVVTIVKEGEQVILFTEKGSWKGDHTSLMNFTNTYRWTLDSSKKILSLEHLRQGKDSPVFLFNLNASSPSSLASIDSHLCGEDIYFGKIYFDAFSLRLHWRVLGPNKNEEIEYFYS